MTPWKYFTRFIGYIAGGYFVIIIGLILFNLYLSINVMTVYERQVFIEKSIDKAVSVCSLFHSK